VTTRTKYGYDQIYELLSATQGGTTTESYTYDPVGNRLSSLELSPYQYNASNELTQTPNALYAQDANGNTTIKTDSTGSTTYTWDYENRLTSVTLPGTGGIVTFKYDPFGRRIEKISSSATSIFAYDGPSLIETVNSTGGIVARYMQGQNIDEPLAMQRGTTTDYYEADGLGSITSLTNPTGAVAQSYTYDSFGNQTNSTGTLRNYFRYTAREFDTETNLYYYRARYYDPTSGRFLSEDPINFVGGINFYAYVKNNVPNTFDPLGLAQCFYRISTHTLTCISNKDHTNKATLGPNGVFSGVGPCRNKPSCSNDNDLGPISPGEYKMNSDSRPGHQFFYRLEPVPPIPGWKVDLGLARGGFELHPGTFSLGCITADKNDPQTMQQYQQLFQLLQSENGNNWLLVAP
jgi:RHS repeat-associated protein